MTNSGMKAGARNDSGIDPARGSSKLADQPVLLPSQCRRQTRRRFERASPQHAGQWLARASLTKIPLEPARSAHTSAGLVRKSGSNDPRSCHQLARQAAAEMADADRSNQG